ncbi:MAG: serine hydrolase [Bacteroidetes bacterium]|nr:serine hydrolase [Bacteroidota bacterium]MBU1677484.1 serine hydrolase [Bacteroidota bacterium]
MLKNILTILIFFAAYWFKPLEISTGNYINGRLNEGAFPLSNEDVEWVEKTLEGMSLKDKCAQLIISYASSVDTSYNSSEYTRMRYLAEELKVGGFVFFKGNILSQAAITNELQKLAEIPLLISADFERGVGMRLHDAVEYPHNMAFGAANDVQLTYLMGKYTAASGRALGVHQNYAPLLDVNKNYKNPIINIRSYSENPDLISWHANAFIQGMHDEGMITTGKHFPGHGATDLDSHSELPVIHLGIDALRESDLIPFKEAIDAGVKSIMVGHLEVPALEDEELLPATMSKSIISDLLKRELGFKGIVVTDAMNMHAITNLYNQDDAAVLSFKAGADLIVFPEDDESAVNGLYNAVIEKQISEERIDESVRKILAAKKWLKLDMQSEIDLNKIEDVLYNKSHIRLAEEVAEKSITLVRNFKDLIPLNANKLKNIACITLSDSRERETIKEPFSFEKLAAEKIKDLKTYRLNLSSRKRHFKEALDIARKSKLIFLAVYVGVRVGEGSVALNDKYVSLLEEFKKLNKPVIFMSFGNPYLIADLTEQDTYLCAYSSSASSQKAMFKSVTGLTDIKGKLPVSIPNTEYNFGFGQDVTQSRLYFAESEGDSTYDFSAVDSLMKKAVADSVFPGGVVLAGHRKRVIYNKAFGNYTYDASSTKVTTESIFDMASVSKVAATTSAAMMLFDEGKIKLGDKVVSFLPEFGNNGKEKITIQNLLVHNSGLPAFKRYYVMVNTKKEIIDDIMNTKLDFEPGSDYTYSDLGMITLQQIIEKVSNKSLDKFLSERLFTPLGMTRTMYNPPAKLIKDCVPTEVDNYWRQRLVQGTVHDENASMLGGVAGHAGLFSTSGDLAKLIFLYLNNGISEGKKYFESETLDYWTSFNAEKGDRALGWGRKSVTGYSSAGSKFSEFSYGHTGFTGTSIWVDKEKGLFVILLSNRVYPTRENRKLVQFRPVLHDAIVDAVTYK